MIPSARAWLIAAAVAALAELHLQTSRADDPPPADSAEETLAAPAALAPPPPSAYVLPPPTWPVYNFPQVDPLLDRPYAAQPGWYTNVETNIVFPHLRNQLVAFVPNKLTGNTDGVQFPGNPLAATVAPRFEVGYRLPGNWGSIQLGYQFLTTQGSDQTTTGPRDVLQAPASQVGSLDFNMADLTYVSRSFALGPFWDLRWGAGARMLTLYFDSRVQLLNPGSTLGNVLSQTEGSGMYGFGAWAFCDLERKMPIPGLAIFGRFEGTDLESRIRQDYTETVYGTVGTPLEFINRFDSAVATPILREVLGVSYTVPRWNYSRFLLGYQYETFFEIGRLTGSGGIPDTRGQLDLQGVFLRAEFNF
ncbi:MAG TPA: hypothetical protein VMG10_20230 [Gemmataceae bacterium]|nr:hypothetical protein [Gemmataceae bacterium]